jgi:hypothetical protein
MAVNIAVMDAGGEWRRWSGFSRRRAPGLSDSFRDLIWFRVEWGLVNGKVIKY